jgi:hypothetical protein
MRKIIIAIGVLILIAVGYFGWQLYNIKQITSFDACVAAKYPVLDSYPPQCTTPDGRVFTLEIGNEQKFTDLIKLTNPRPNQKVASPLSIKGEARGSWFFEATFPVELIDDNNTSLGKGFASAQGDWMTESFVPFHVELPFINASTPKGKLIIKNANPSGLSENEKEMVIPVVF